MNILTIAQLISDRDPVVNSQYDAYTYEQVEELMIEFAKMHVEAALEAAYNNHEIVRSNRKLDDYDYADSSHYTADKRSIINAYPLTNIQ